MAVVIPAGLSYRLFNPSDRPLELFLAAEETPDGFVPARELSVGRYRDSLPLVGAHWAHIARPFVYDHEPKFANPMGFVVVSVDAFDIAQPHTHPAAAEEIWLQVKGDEPSASSATGSCARNRAKRFSFRRRTPSRTARSIRTAHRSCGSSSGAASEDQP